MPASVKAPRTAATPAAARKPRTSTKATAKTTAKTTTKTAASGTAKAARPDVKAGSSAKNAETAAPAPEIQSTNAEDRAPDVREMKRQELVKRVVERSKVKKKYAKPVIEAMLSVLGETLADGRELNLQPLGKVKLNRSREMSETRVIVARIRQTKAGGATVAEPHGNSAKEVVAEPAQDS